MQLRKVKALKKSGAERAQEKAHKREADPTSGGRKKPKMTKTAKKAKKKAQ